MGEIHTSAAQAPSISGEKTQTSNIRGLETSDDTKLERGLKARHITMIAIGGAVGTGLIIGTGRSLATAGPGSIFISYSMMGVLVYTVMCGLGEMAAWLPMSAGFTGYASRFCHPSLGFALGWCYWFKYIIVTPNQLTAASLVIQYWVDRDKINPGVFIAIFLVVIVCINYFGIRFFGEFEFWLSSFKVITILSLIMMSFILVLGGGPDHDRKGFRYWDDPGAFATYKNIPGNTGRFVAFWSTMINAVFAYLGTELVGVTVGEAQNPRRTIPRAIRLTFWRIVVFYILSVLLIGCLVPYNSPELAFANKSSSSAAASPFVVAIKLAGIDVLPDIINACILVFVFSASNSDLYIASRTLYALASDGNAPAIFKRTDKSGVPIYALGLSAFIACLAFMNVSDDSKKIFNYLVNLVTIFGLLTWISILITHIYFVKGRVAQGLTDDQMPYVAPFGLWGSYIALFLCIVVAITKNFTAFIGGFDKVNFITGYIGIPIYIIGFFGHRWYTKSKFIPSDQIDFYTGKDIIDKEEEEFLAQQEAYEAANPPTGMAKFYAKYVSWVF
ncbi:Dicarboxylic amino acid permease [Ceratocystis fimbriata CBS 114723]|uniref:Dicarboxylic amino acid permease n=1 Tax=Ceratocystis fimbriata CBS 114723 TaxID=1035309 RepID=A0A2C5WS86_9PEZI|nr:Dicarboxylic amino acid permease [Ceratocystis fimbriata CBS 114723]